MAKMLDGLAPHGSRSVSWPWYHQTLTTELTPNARSILEKYSGIPSDEVETHIYSIRDKAWGIFPWPCVGEFWFLSFGLSKHPLYKTMVLPRLRAGGTLLDLGSCLGQDIRKCIVDGAPAERIFASDLFPEYEDLAYSFWRDRDKIPADHFVADNILADNDDFVTGPLMTRFGPGQIDIISITMFLHLFDYLNQLKTAARLLRLLSHKPGSMIVGSQAGSIIAGEQPLKPPFDGTESGTRRTVFRHNPSSFERLWKKAGRAAGVPLKVSAVLQAPEEFPDGVDSGFDFATKLRRFRPGTQTRRLYFSIMRT